MNKFFAKKDIIVLLLLLAAGLILLFIFHLFSFKNGEYIRIEVNEEIYGEYSLSEDQEIPIKQDNETTNIIVIKDNKCFMKDADCPDKLCVKMGKISRVNQTIVCLPNKVVVRVCNDDENSTEFDSIAQ